MKRRKSRKGEGGWGKEENEGGKGKKVENRGKEGRKRGEEKAEEEKKALYFSGLKY